MPFVESIINAKPLTLELCGCVQPITEKGKKHCASKAVPEPLLIAATVQVLGLLRFDPEVFEKRIDHIDVLPDNLLRYVFTDGTTETFQWKDRSRSESWTSEMRAAVGKKARERNKKRRASNG